MYYIVVTALIGATPIHVHVLPGRFRTEMECQEAIPDIARSRAYIPPAGASYGFGCVKIDDGA